MEPLTISWIGQCATSPIVLLLSVWAIGVFHSYRRHWMSVDLFLLAMITQELVMSLQVLIFSLLNLLKPEVDVACGAFVWSMNATRALQLGTVASLLADRALTCHWPYRYRFSIRRHQLRYHLGVLAAMAALLGIAALLVRPQQESEGFPDCLTMPYDLHVRLALFLLAVYGALVLITVLSSVVVQTSRGCSGDSVEVTTSSLNLASNSATVKSTDSSTTDRPLPPSFSSTNGSRGRSLKTSASTASSASSSTVGMRGASSTADLLPSNSTGVSGNRGVLRNTSTTTSSGSTIPGGCDFRWSTCACVAFVSCALNHIPYLVFVSLGTFTPRLLPPFSPDNICLWLSLLQGVLLPPLLLVVDGPFRRGAREASCWWKSSGTVGEISGSGGSTLIQNSAAPFSLFPREETKSFPLTNGSLFSSLLSLPGDNGGNSYYRKDSAPHTFRMGLHHHPSTSSGGFRAPIGPASHEGNPNSGGSYGSSPYFYHHSTATSIEPVSADPLYSDPTNKDSSSSGSSKEDHIYATLSETFSSMSSFSDGGYLDDPSDSQHTRCASVTTIANDDFEFHDPRSGGQFNSIQEKPSVLHHPKPTSAQYHKNMALEQYTKAGDQYKMGPSYQQYHMLGPNHNKLAVSERNNKINIGPTSINSNVSAASVDLASFGYKNDRSTYVINSACNQNVHYRYPNETHSVEAFSNNIPLDTSKQEYNIKDYNDHSNTLSGRTKATLSLSMNDLDSLGNIKDKEVSTDDQMMFVLPVKSESMLSLYRLYLAEEEMDRSRMFIPRPVKSSRSESDLSCLAEDNNSIPSLSSDGGNHGQTSHEIYQKHRKQSHSNSKIRRQSKIQRARGVQSRTKPVVPSKNNSHQSYKNTHESDINKLNRLLESTGNSNSSPSSNSVQVSIMDNKNGRQNGVISINDPSEVSVQELFTVLNRAHPKEGASKVTLNRVGDLEISSVGSQSGQTSSQTSVNQDAFSKKKSDGEFKKIFVSEFL